MALHQQRAAIDEIPRIDPVVAPQVQLEQLALPVGRSLPVACLEIHDAHRADANGMDRAVEQSLDLGRRHLHAFFRKGEDLAHPDAAVIVRTIGTGWSQGLQSLLELRRRVLHAHEGSSSPLDAEGGRTVP